ncbi:MAG: hypothetical protein IPK22_23375 [Verrucomicrobiaceae bacterium]|nr:hypothetical protein [Verrucomicrobiaceae bacterium]
MSWPVHPARIIRGHRVASGLNGDPRFPGGTVAMQLPHFARLGLDLSAYHQGTLNVDISPLTYRPLKPRQTFEHVQWHPVEPAETFSFFDARLLHAGQTHEVLIYFPHPETKPEHFQAPTTLEILAPWIEGLSYETIIQLAIDPEQMILTSPAASP